MIEKLKKVESSESDKARKKRQLHAKVRALNEAYRSKDGYKVDKAVQGLFKFLDASIDLSIPKNNVFYTRVKNYTWEQNHLKVLASMSNLMQKLGRVPSATELSNEAGLSEETIYKHLREFNDHELYKQERNKYKMLIHRVLTQVFNLGMEGDIRACKTYLDFFTQNTPALPLEQTNYIQINNVKITPNELENLPPATLDKIEQLIKAPIHKHTRARRTANKSELSTI